MAGRSQGERNPKRRAKRLHDLSDVSSVGIMARGPLDEYRFNMYMRDLLAEKAKDIFRCKGVLSVHVSGVTGRGCSGAWRGAGADADACTVRIPRRALRCWQGGVPGTEYSCPRTAVSWY